MRLRGLFLFLLIIGIMSIGVLNAQWTYQKTQTINQLANTGTGYQVKFVAHYGNGTDSGVDVYLNNHARSDFGDVRFFEGATELSYWMESMTSGNNAIFWVKLNGDLSTAARTVRIIYGNAQATTTSNGENTFEFFDDFNGNLNKWVTETASGSYPSLQAGGFLRCGGGSATTPYGFTSIGSSPSYTGFQNNAVMYRTRVASQGISEVAFRGVRGAAAATNTGYKGRIDNRAAGTGGYGLLQRPYVVGTWTFITGTAGVGTPPTADTWYRVDITAYGSNFALYSNGSLMQSVTSSTYAGPGEIAMQNHFGSYSDFDWVAVRKFAGSEPTRGSFSAETLPVELSSFTATITAEYFVQLHWTTQSETDVTGFYILRSNTNSLANAIVVSPLVTATNTSSETSYSYIDSEVQPGTWYYWLENLDMSGMTAYHGPITAVVTDEEPNTPPIIPLQTAIMGAYPNPFNPSTIISYGVVNGSNVKLEIVNIKGQVVSTLVNGFKNSGTYRQRWDGTNSIGQPVSSGIYIVRMIANGKVFNSKIVLSK